jgi:glycosyltransferase involved in cell wall biosynthesis
VVSTPVCGAVEALEAGEGIAPGRVVAPTPEGVADALGALLADRAERGAMAEAARRRTREGFAWEKTVARWEEILGG